MNYQAWTNDQLELLRTHWIARARQWNDEGKMQLFVKTCLAIERLEAELAKRNS